MSPILELQRRMVEAGRIRAGEKGDKGEPRKLDKWRLTSKDRQRLVEAADLWGGEVRAWEGHAGEYELYTETDVLPIMLLPGHAPTTWYELWSRGGCQRRCDGQHELISDSSCLCGGDERECKPYTRLSVLLPDLPGIGSWLLTSTGWNAAAELAGAADLLQRASAQGILIPARLRLEQRVQVTGGQTRRFAVPVIDIDVSFRELLGGSQGSLPPSRPALPSGYVPLAGNGVNGPSLAEGLTAAETQTVARGARSAAPIPETDVDLDGDTDPVPVDDAGASTPPGCGGSPPRDAPATFAENIAALNAIVGTLRDAKKITTRQVWVSMARARGVKVDEMIALLGGTGEDGELHWSPLRDSLDETEAAELRKRMGKFWAENMTEPEPVA